MFERGAMDSLRESVSKEASPAGRKCDSSYVAYQFGARIAADIKASYDSSWITIRYIS